jgi:hypothetical protein
MQGCAAVRNIGRAIFVAVGVLGAAPVFAADLPTKKPAPAAIPELTLPSSWTVDLTFYGWALNMTGNAGIGRFATSPFFVSFEIFCATSTSLSWQAPSRAMTHSSAALTLSGRALGQV